MEPFVKATYKLEGDGPLSLAYQKISILFASVSTQHYPNVAAVAKAEAKGNASHEQQLLDCSKACVQPAYDYFYLKFNNDLKPVLDVFKAARLFSPFKFHELKPSATDIDCLKAFPFLSSHETIDGLKMEIPMYSCDSWYQFYFHLTIVHDIISVSKSGGYPLTVITTLGTALYSSELA